MQKIFKQLINRPDFDLFLHLLEIKWSTGATYSLATFLTESHYSRNTGLRWDLNRFKTTGHRATSSAVLTFSYSVISVIIL
jgi:hypothetical protein